MNGIFFDVCGSQMVNDGYLWFIEQKHHATKAELRAAVEIWRFYRGQVKNMHIRTGKGILTLALSSDSRFFQDLSRDWSLLPLSNC
jgi:hypothetical protein